jgi:hypothetical protein
MDKFDRAFQKKILESLYESYPNACENAQFRSLEKFFEDESLLIANMLYLEAHGLIDSGLIQTLQGYVINSSATRITAKGIDFVQHDGGLGAILNVQTIKFHREAVVVLEDLIALSNLDTPEKENAKFKLSQLTSEALKAVIQTATSAGMTALLK